MLIPCAGNEPVKNLNKNNAQQAIVLEAIALALALDGDPEVSIFGRQSLTQLHACPHLQWHTDADFDAQLDPGHKISGTAPVSAAGPEHATARQLRQTRALPQLTSSLHC